MSNNRIRLIATSAMTAATVSILPIQAANAAPAGGNVVGGTATISVDGLATKIDQTTSRAAINWTSFDVGSKESVTFNVPNNGATLNRVTGNVSTKIQGTVTSNGTLYLVNPNGIVFEAGSKVTAQNFVASTGTIDTTKFMENKYGEKLTLGLPTVNSTIDLRGNITVADRGVIGIFAPQIKNSSNDIVAKLGSVNLAGAQVTTIDFIGDGLMNFEVGNDSSSAQYYNSIDNSGTITAIGGTVTMTANGYNGVINGVINSGTITANGGTVTMTASGYNGVTNSGTITANGGTVTMTASGHYGVINSGTITANGGTVTMTASGDYGVTNSGMIDVSIPVDKVGTGGTVNITTVNGFTFESGSRILAAGSENYGSGGINIVSTGGMLSVNYIKGVLFDGGGGGVSIATNGSYYSYMDGAVTVKGSKLTIDLLNHTTGQNGKLYFGWNKPGSTLTALGVDFTYTGDDYYFARYGGTVYLGDGYFIYNKYLVNANGGNYMIANQILTSDDNHESYLDNAIKLNNPANYGHGLVVYNGSATISGVTGSSITLINTEIAPTNLKSITANGITVTGKNVFSGDIKLVSYGQVGATATNQDSKAGISIRNGASISATGSLTLEQRSNVTAANQLGASAYGMVIDSATLNAGKNLTLSNYGIISSSRGVASGIYIMGDSSGQARLSAGGDLRMSSAGTISSTSDSAYGVMVDASSGGKAYLSAGGDLKFGVMGKIYSTNMSSDAYGVMINGNSSSEFKLSAGRDMLVAQNAAIASKSSNGYGISVAGTAMLNANNDIKFTQNGAIYGSMGAFGINVNGKGGVAALNANNDIKFTQNGAITGSGASYGILVDGKGGVAALNANNDINFIQEGAITGSSASYGILVDGSTVNSSAKLTAIHDMNFTQNGTISATGTGGNAYGILIDASSSGSAVLKANHNIILTQNGLVDSIAGDANSLHINGMTSGMASLDSGNDVIITSNNSSQSHAGLKNALGIYLYDARVKANNDIIIDQIGDSQSERGGSFGLLIYNTTRPQSPDYSLYAIRDVRFTENGMVKASGKFNYAVGVVAENARIVAGRNVVGYQGGDVFQNYNGEAAGFHITGTEINAGNPDNINQAAPDANADKLKPGSIYLGQTGNINNVSPTPALINDTKNQEAPASKLTVDTRTTISAIRTTVSVPHLPIPTDKGVAYGLYLDSSQFFATTDITINQSGNVGSGKQGIYLTSSGTDANKSLTFSAGATGGTINLISKDNSVKLVSNAEKTFDEENGEYYSTPSLFKASGGALHIDLGTGNFDAGNEMLDATAVKSLIITLPKDPSVRSDIADVSHFTGGKVYTSTTNKSRNVAP